MTENIQQTDPQPNNSKFYRLVGSVLGLIFGPIFTILSINTLFGLNIQVTFYTWLSTLWLTLLVLYNKSKDNVTNNLNFNVKGNEISPTTDKMFH